MHDKHQNIEEPCEVKVSCTVLETSESREGLAEFNKLVNCGHLSIRESTVLKLERISIMGC